MAKKYKIIVNYDTGDSFGRQPNCKCELVEEWNDLDIAKENLRRIQAHYKAHQKINGWNNYGKNSWENYKHEDWYAIPYPDYSVTLVKDDGSTYRETATWCGYFESMNYAEIITPIEDGLKIYPD